MTAHASSVPRPVAADRGDEEPTDAGLGSAPLPPGRVTWMEPGALLAGKYRLVTPVGDGGAGTVWAALHVPLGRVVALKVLRSRQRDDAEARERFRREARAAGSLCHPGIVQPLDFGTLDDGREYFAMEYVEGQTLRELLESRGALPWRTVQRIGIDVADALTCAHERGVVHRDIKPANLILDERGPHGDRVRLLDLGIARDERLSGARNTLTGHGVVLGTPRFAAPEQLRAERVGPQADLYSLGVVLYAALTGRLPYDGRTFAQVAEAQSAGPPTPPSTLAPDPTRPPAFDALVLELLAHRLEDRPQRARDVRGRLEALEGRCPFPGRGACIAGALALLATGAAAGAAAVLWVGG